MGRELLDIQAAIECRFTLKRVRDMIITYSYYSLLLRKGVANQKPEISVSNLERFYNFFKVNESGVLRLYQIVSILLTINKNRLRSLLHIPNMV